MCALALLASACQPAAPIPTDPVPLPPVDYSELRFEWALDVIEPATPESVRSDALAPARERDDAESLTRFRALLDAVDQSGLPDVSALAFWRVDGVLPVHNGAMPRGEGYWASKWSRGDWVVDTEGRTPPSVQLTTLVPPELVADPDMLALATRSRRGDARRQRFADFVYDQIVAMEKTERGYRQPTAYGGSYSLDRAQWLRWARWAQMVGDAESAVALLEQYEREVQAACADICGEEEETVRGCDLAGFARADLARRIEDDALDALRSQHLPWRSYARRLETALALDPPLDPSSARYYQLSAVRSYMTRRRELEPTLARGLAALTAKERVEALLVLWPDLHGAEATWPSSAHYALAEEIDSFPIDVLPAATWYFGEGFWLPMRSGGRGLFKPGSRGGTLGWRLCDHAETRWLPERERGWCGTGGRACGLEVILNRLPPETRARLPALDEAALAGGEHLPYVEWDERVRGLVSCGELEPRSERERRDALALECALRGALDPAARAQRGARRFARLAGKLARSDADDIADADHSAWSRVATWSLERLVARAEMAAPGDAVTLAPTDARRVSAALTVLERERGEAGLGELDECDAMLNAFDGPVSGLALGSLEDGAPLASWHEQHHERLTTLVTDALCRAHFTDSLRTMEPRERYRRRYRGRGLDELQSELMGVTTPSPLLNALVSVRDARFVKRADDSDGDPPSSFERVIAALRQPAREAGVELPVIPASEAGRDALCEIETLPPRKRRR